MSRFIGLLATGVSLTVATPAAHANTEERPLRFDLGATLTHFQQQAKTEIGGERGERLVEQTEVGLAALATWQLHSFLHLGLFTQLDMGLREAGNFGGFGPDGATQLDEAVGGSYWEWWLGPVVRGQYRALFAEVGWGALGLRDDHGRDDILDDSGRARGAFRVTPSVAWLVALGGSVPLTEDLELALRLEYRVRYYLSRGGRDLFGESALGSQNLTPFVGVAWYP